ncbi:DUF6461 domain-containing protein [Nocardia sp. NPDC051030]|uniref:DUF6461 domain-containing protein n=1 Tax=Nocardia sp. NPDC051030 TaxID=3155162 RepID=UPI0034150A6B
MATTDPLAPFQWLNASESQAGPLGVIFSIAFFRNLEPAAVVRRFSNGADSGQESDFEELSDGHVGVFRAGAWSVAIAPYGWWMTDDKMLAELSRHCEVLAITRHDYAVHSLAYAIDGKIVTGHRLWYPHIRWGCDPDRLNDYMRELGMELDMTDDDYIYDADEDEPESDSDAWDISVSTGVPRAFALAAKVTGVSFTADMLDQPLLIGPVDHRWAPAHS